MKTMRMKKKVFLEGWKECTPKETVRMCIELLQHQQPSEREGEEIILGWLNSLKSQS